MPFGFGQCCCNPFCRLPTCLAGNSTLALLLADIVTPGMGSGLCPDLPTFNGLYSLQYTPESSTAIEVDGELVAAACRFHAELIGVENPCPPFAGGDPPYANAWVCATVVWNKAGHENASASGVDLWWGEVVLQIGSALLVCGNSNTLGRWGGQNTPTGLLPGCPTLVAPGEVASDISGLSGTATIWAT